MLYRLFGWLFFAAALSGCGELKLDGSTDESLAESIHAMVRSVPQAERERLTQAIHAAAESSLHLEWLRSAAEGRGFPSGAVLIPAARDRHDGMTIPELHERAAVLRLEWLEQEITMAEARRGNSQFAQETLAEVGIVDAKLVRERFMLGWRNLVEVTVHNGFSRAIGTLEFHGVYGVPGREIPLTDGPIRIEFPGGIEPGETLTETTANLGSPWIGLEPAPGATLRLELQRVAGADWSTIHRSAWWTYPDEERLEAMREERARLAEPR